MLMLLKEILKIEIQSVFGHLILSHVCADVDERTKVSNKAVEFK